MEAVLRNLEWIRAHSLLFPAKDAGCVEILASNHFRNILVAIAAKPDDGIYIQNSKERDVPKNSLELFEMVDFFIAHFKTFLCL